MPNEEDDDGPWYSKHRGGSVGDLDDCWEIRKRLGDSTEVIAYVDAETMADILLQHLTYSFAHFEVDKEY